MVAFWEVNPFAIAVLKFVYLVTLLYLQDFGQFCELFCCYFLTLGENFAKNIATIVYCLLVTVC